MRHLPQDPGNDTPDLPQPFAELAEDLAAMSGTERDDLLVELSTELPSPPEDVRGDSGFERVAECQSPVHVLARVEGDLVGLYVDSPPSAVATRALAAILHEGIDGRPAADVLALPADLPLRLGLQGTVSPLRLAGMAGMLARVQRQVRAAVT